MVIQTRWNSRVPAIETKGGTNNASYAVGDLLYASAADTLSRLPIGAESDVLGSTGTIPAWQTGETGSYQFIKTVSGSGGSNVDITSAINGSYQDYLLVVTRLTNSDFGNAVRMRFSTDNGSSFLTNALYGYYCRARKALDGALDTSFSATDTRIQLTPGSEVKSGTSFRMYIHAPFVGTIPRLTWTGNYLQNDGFAYAADVRGSACFNSSIAINALRFTMVTGTITGGTFSIYGIKNS